MSDSQLEAIREELRDLERVGGITPERREAMSKRLDRIAGPAVSERDVEVMVRVIAARKQLKDLKDEVQIRADSEEEGHMTVKELLNMLHRYPPGAEVTIFHDRYAEEAENDPTPAPDITIAAEDDVSVVCGLHVSPEVEAR